MKASLSQHTVADGAKALRGLVPGHGLAARNVDTNGQLVVTLASLESTVDLDTSHKPQRQKL